MIKLISQKEFVRRTFSVLRSFNGGGSKKGREAGFAPIITFLLIATLFIAGYFLYGQTSFPKDRTSKQSIQPLSTPDETANRKTYTNNKVGFSFLYPPNLKYLYEDFPNFKINHSGSISVQDFDGTKTIGNNQSYFQFHVNIFEDSKLSLEQYVSNLRSTISVNLKKNQKLSDTTSITVGGIKAIKGEDMVHYQLVPAVWLKYRTFLLTIDLITSEPVKQQIFDQILSTFKFLDQNQVDVTNEINGFPVYPKASFLQKDTYPPCKEGQYSGYSFCNENTYTWETREDWDSVNNYYKDDKANFGWKCSGGAGSIGGPRNATTETTCSNGNLKYSLTIKADSQKTEIILGIPISN